MTVSRCWWTSSGTGSCRASSKAHRSSATIKRQIGDLKEPGSSMHHASCLSSDTMSAAAPHEHASVWYLNHMVVGIINYQIDFAKRIFYMYICKCTEFKIDSCISVNILIIVIRPLPVTCNVQWTGAYMHSIILY